MIDSSKLAPVFGLFLWVAICFLAAAIGAAATLQAGSIYVELVRPAWSPPASVFGPVWTALYALMAIAAWLVWQARQSRLARVALVFFMFQLILNALWSWLFFGWNQRALAFLDILLLWVLIVATLVAFWRVRPLAGALLIPYLLWVTFASALNYSMWQLN